MHSIMIRPGANVNHAGFDGRGISEDEQIDSSN